MSRVILLLLPCFYDVDPNTGYFVNHNRKEIKIVYGEIGMF